MLLVANMELEATNGMMGQCTLVTGERIKSLVSEYIHGLMVDVTRESGSIIIWKEWESTSGTMAECIKDSIKTIRSMALESTPGLIKDVMKDIGTRANSMV